MFFQQNKNENGNRQEGLINVQRTTNIYAERVEVRGETAYVSKHVHVISKEEVAAFSAECFAAGEFLANLLGGVIFGCVRIAFPIVRTTAKVIAHVSIFAAKETSKAVIILREKHKEIAAKETKNAVECEVVEGHFVPSTKNETAQNLSVKLNEDTEIVRRAIAQIQLNKPNYSPLKGTNHATSSFFNRDMPIHITND